jgi:pimeloyl-ACP methyl ester carboxylesterase
MVSRLTKRYESDGLMLDAMLYPPPGVLVDAGGHKLHVLKQGDSGPTVVLESGIASSCLTWCLVDQEIARFATVYSYDRAGFGWSPYNDKPKIARSLIEEMRLALAAAGAPTPRIVVGHSFGGLLMRIYAAMYPEEVSGVVLVDALPAEEWFPLNPQRTHTLRRAAQMTARGAWLARHGIVRFALRSLERGSSTIPRIFSFLSGAGRMSVPQRVAEQLVKFPPKVRGQIRAHWSRASSFHALADYLAELPASCAQAMICPDLGDMPLIVLSAEKGRTGHVGRQAKLAKLSTRGDFRMIAGSTHWIMLDDPASVIEAVHDLVT